MLDKVPHFIGAALTAVRAGETKLVIERLALPDGCGTLAVKSEAFADGGPMPERLTGDGAGISPPLAWTGLPAGARSLALIVEDPDAPLPSPMVHAIVHDIAPSTLGLAEAAIGTTAQGWGRGEPGRNGYGKTGWLPPDPPPGHGEHRYVFQLFALDCSPQFDKAPDRDELVDALAGHVLAAGTLIGTYERG